ncbi:MAG: hypothetical protein IJ315_04345 [Firmicutes bacterium]|nr:hypothetical protein [Bacillota bacterium]
MSESVDTVIWEINRETGEVCELLRFEHTSDYGMVGENPVRSWEGKIYYEMKQDGQWYLESLDVITKERKIICKLEENEEFGGVYWGAGVAAMMVRNEMGLTYTTPVDYETKTNAGLPIIEVME